MKKNVAAKGLERLFVEIYTDRLSIIDYFSNPDLDNSLSSELILSQPSKLNNDSKNKTYFGVEATLPPLDHTRDPDITMLNLMAPLLNRADAGGSFASTAGLLNIWDL